MAVRNSPIQAINLSAESYRLQLVTGYVQTPGIVVGTDLAVSQNGTPNMTVNVAAGGAFIPGTQTATQGTYSAFSDATANLAIAASNPTNPRIDLVVFKVQDAAYSGGTNAASLAVVTGTPAASPVPPAAPNNSITLAQVAVAALTTTIVNANITDTRQRWLPYDAEGEVAYAEITAISGTFTTIADIAGLTVTYPFLAGRKYRLSAYGLIRSSVADDTVRIAITDGSNFVQAYGQANIHTASNDVSVFAVKRVIPGAGTFTYKVRGERASGTGNGQVNAGSSFPAFIMVEDIGPV